MTPNTAPIAITDLDSLRDAGLKYPKTVDGWRWAYRKRHERGIADAFGRQGRCIVVFPDRYIAATREQS